MHRFFVTEDRIEGGSVRFAPEQAHQVARVLRLGPGDTVCVLDGSGLECPAVLDEVSPTSVTAHLGQWRPCPGEPCVHLCLGIGLLKGEKMDWAVQKATEVGASEIVPIVCTRSVARVDADRASAKVSRWQRIAQEAAEQCRRGLVPVVASPMSLSALLERALDFDRILLADEGAPACDSDSLRLKLVSPCGRWRPAGPGSVHVLLLVGPEGSFTPEEAQAARTAGAIPISLGPRILRAETAAVVGTALVLHELEK